jgi:hypothetical protein
VERPEAEAILDGDRETAVALLMRVDGLVEANRRLEARVGEREQRLSRCSRNSSLPPSQDPPSAPPRPQRRGSGRGRGGQPGHEGRSRRRLALDQVDEVFEHWPERCHACARAFGEDERLDAAAPQRVGCASSSRVDLRWIYAGIAVAIRVIWPRAVTDVCSVPIASMAVSVWDEVLRYA